MKSQNLHRTRADRHFETGQGLVEYALILVLVAVVVIVILALLGPTLGRTFERVACSVRFGADYIGYVTAEDGSDYVIDGKNYRTGNVPANPVIVADPACLIRTGDTGMGVPYTPENLFDEGVQGQPFS